MQPLLSGTFPAPHLRLPGPRQLRETPRFLRDSPPHSTAAWRVSRGAAGALLFISFLSETTVLCCLLTYFPHCCPNTLSGFPVTRGGRGVGGKPGACYSVMTGGRTNQV